MTLRNIKIHNFRSVSKLDISTDNNKVLCFVGENGSAKTSVLSLIAESIVQNTSMLFPNYDERDDKRYRSIKTGEVKKGERFYSVEIAYQSAFKKTFTYKKIVSNLKKLNPEIYANIISDISIRNGIFGEVVTKADRGDFRDDYVQSNIFLVRPGSRFEPYEYDHNVIKSEINLLENKANVWGYYPFSFEVSYTGSNLQNILLDMVFDAVIGYKDSRLGLSKVREILSEVVGKDFGKITISKSPHRIIKFSNVGSINALSQGEVDILVTISSIIKRQIYIFQKYNSDDKEKLGLNSFFEIPGIVIIDEIDLHLHPRAQEKYVSVLTSMFPNINFVLSTHSPFVIRGLPEKSQVVSLPSGLIFNENFKAMDIDSITNIIFGYEGGFSKDINLLLIEFKKLLVSEGDNMDKLKAIYDELSSSESAKEELELLMATFSDLVTVNNIKG